MALVFDKNNRIITVEKPQTTLTIQDLHDDIRLYEELNQNLEVAQIVNASGKQSLGGGVTVGITLELINNWRLAFEARDGIEEGGGTILCVVSGGNLVATNDYNNNPIYPTAFTQVTISQSSSATITTPPSDVNLLYLVESMRGGSSSTLGNIYYWAPVGGNDSNDGTSPSTAVLTFAAAHDLATSGNNDIIFCLSTDTSGITEVDDTLTITKNSLKVRGPGFPFQIKPTTSGSNTLSISAANVEVSGLYLETAGTGTDNGISITGNNNLIKDCWIANVQGHGISLSTAARNRIETSAIENCGLSGTGNGINIGNNATQSLVKKCVMFSCDNGASLSGTGLSDNVFENNLAYNNSEYGISIGSGVVRTVVRGGHTFANNTSGSTQDDGSQTYIETPSGGASASEVADAVWDELITDHLAANSSGRTLRDAKTRATLASLK
jgi:hypothetical protein